MFRAIGDCISNGDKVVLVICGNKYLLVNVTKTELYATETGDCIRLDIVTSCNKEKPGQQNTAVQGQKVVIASAAFRLCGAKHRILAHSHNGQFCALTATTAYSVIWLLVSLFFFCKRKFINEEISIVQCSIRMRCVFINLTSHY